MKVFFSGIGGVGIGPLAEIASDAGHEVVGSDLSSSLMTDQLESRGIKVYYNQDGKSLVQEHLKSPIDLFIHTAALTSDHPELTIAAELKIRTAKRDELVSQIITEKNLKLIAIAGTHGKTTTTGMMTWALEQLGIPISYSVGSTLPWGPSGRFDARSEYFVYECDEFDRNFLKFHPHLSLITSVKHDHPDTYPTEDEYKAAFRQFVAQSESTIIWQHDTEYTGNLSGDLWILQDSDVNNLTLAGAHNRRNASLIMKAFDKLKLGDKDAVKMALEAFPGTKRRFEKLAENLYTDYGHTPDEIAATLQMAKELAKEVVLIYQPHQNIRQHSIRDAYTDEVFRDASDIYWLPTYLSREDPSLEVLSPSDLMLCLKETKAIEAKLDDDLWDNIQRSINAGKLVLVMGAGSIDEWVRDKAQS